MVFEQLRQVLATQLEIDEHKITLESDLIEDLGADSLDAIEIIMMVEQRFNLEIPIKELAGVYRVFDIVDYIEKHI